MPDLAITIIPDIDGARSDPDARGWVYDHLSLTCDGVPAGYIRVGCIPQDQAARLYPNRGWDLLRVQNGLRQLPADPFDPKAQAMLALYSRPEADIADPTERLCQVQANERSAWARFSILHIQRPKVDFINIYTAKDQERIPTQGRGDFAPRPAINFQGRGLGMLLYREAARWLARCGDVLHASGCRQPAASNTWARLAALVPNAITTDRRRGVLAQVPKELRTSMWVLDGQRLPPWRPDWADSLTVCAPSQA